MTDTESYVEIARLSRAYADISTRHAWDEMASLAVPAARFCFRTQSGMFEVEGAAAFGELGARMAERFSFHLLVPLNFVIELEGDGRARGRSYLLEVAEEHESRQWSEVYGIYNDEYMLYEGSWRFSRREYSALGRRAEGKLALP